MGKSVDKIAQEIRELPDVEKLRLVDAIRTDLDKPEPEIDRDGRRRRANGGRLTKPARSQPSPIGPSWPNTAARESKFSHLSSFLI
jgi:hypothetical protein